jgi:hypothetical protein
VSGDEANATTRNSDSVRVYLPTSYPSAWLVAKQLLILYFILSSSVASAARGERMKQAKNDAKDLISTYRAERQAEFNNMVLSAGGTGGSYSAKLQGETNAGIQGMEAQFQRNAQKAIDVLLSKCCEVSLEVPAARIRSTQKAFGM